MVDNKPTSGVHFVTTQGEALVIPDAPITYEDMMNNETHDHDVNPEDHMNLSDENEVSDTPMLPPSGFAFTFETETLLRSFVAHAEETNIQLFRTYREHPEFVQFVMRMTLECVMDQLMGYLMSDVRPLDPLSLPDYELAWNAMQADGESEDENEYHGDDGVDACEE